MKKICKSKGKKDGNLSKFE